MAQALGMIEFKTVSTGITVADRMVKTATIEIVEAQTVCPGKYIAIFKGELSAINYAVEIAKTQYEDNLIGTFVLGNPHKDIFPAIYGTTQIEAVKALGILETYDAVTAIVAADMAVKTSDVTLIELRIAKGMCGKSYMMITGDVAAVEVAIEVAKKHSGETGMYLDSSVIAQPDMQICKSIL